MNADVNATARRLLRRDNYLSASVAFFHVSEGVRSVAQAVTPVDDRRHASGGHEVPHGGQVLLVHSGQEEYDLAAREERTYQPADQPGQHPREGNVSRRSDSDVGSFRIQDAAALRKGMVAHAIENDVVTLSGFREILLRVVDDFIRAEGADEIDIPRAAHAG